MTKPEPKSILEIFESNYSIPIYQRNYAWTNTEIEQLIEDIDSLSVDSGEQYFLGNLIVNLNDEKYEVTDGQQRLTTLYLLLKYLDLPLSSQNLDFEARKKSNQTLKYIRYIHKDQEIDIREDILVDEIIEGYNIIETYFKTQAINKKDFRNKLERVLIVRVQVPEDIDLNHYFEIMNTRGEQLEMHEIAKAKILEALETDKERETAALIWEKCSVMDSYIQMNFNTDIRRKLFTKDWSGLDSSINNFHTLNHRIVSEDTSVEKHRLIDILTKDEKIKVIKDSDRTTKNKSERFESTLTFPNFLLQVNAVVRDLEEGDTNLDDKRFLNNLSWNWTGENRAERARNFIFYLLKIRTLFDRFILKREYAKDFIESGKWSLQRLEKDEGKNRGKNANKYVGTIKEDVKRNRLLRTLQSSLRVTYTSPKTMHWITQVLSALLADEETDLIYLLENYAIQKVAESDFKEKEGFGFERIVFTYLDYLLYRDGYYYKGNKVENLIPDQWEFQFRNSIEHFYPQNPEEGESWEEKDLNTFGNLALITISGNSKFSNLTPSAKISYDSIIQQSPKLTIMKEMIEKDNERWSEEKAKIHKKEMFAILEKEIRK